MILFQLIKLDGAPGKHLDSGKAAPGYVLTTLNDAAAEAT